MGRYIGICAWFVPGDTLAEKVQFVNHVGLDGLELDFNHWQGEYGLAREDVQQELKDLREKHGVDYPAIAINSLCEFGMSNPDCWEKVEYALTEGIKAAANLNIPIVQLPSFFGGDIETEAQFDQTVRAIQFACDLAVDHNIIIGSENALPGDKQLQLVERVERANFKIYFDCRNSWWMKGIESPPILRKVLPHICEVHLKDGIDQNDTFTLLGQGNAGVDEVLAILKEANYDGRILLENDYNQFAREGLDPIEQVQRDKQYIFDRL